MITRTIFSIINLLLACPLIAVGQETPYTAGSTREDSRSRMRKVSADAVPIPSGPRLKDISPLDGSFPLLMGGTTNALLLETSAGVIIEREFQYITPTNAYFVS